VTAGFKKLGEREVYAGHVIGLAVGTFEAPDGSTFDRDLVHHPGAVSVVAVADDGRVPLVRQYRAALDRELLEIPAGKLDVADEDPEDCARRELAEEVGLQASSWELLCEFHNSPGFSDERHRVFIARGLTEVPHDRQGVEERSMTVEWVTLADAVGLVRSGRLLDAKTVIGLLLADELLHRS
jgi:8-oxo-dGTP pyrophosphatase MutT (NUDIX family)